MTPDEFVEKGKIDPINAEKDIISVSTENARCEKGEITAATVGNALKAIRLLLEMNDVSLNWKKIDEFFPEQEDTHLTELTPLGKYRKLLKRLISEERH
jgi:hypothetical protein